MKNRKHPIRTSSLLALICGLLLAGAHAQAQVEIKDRLGSYDVFLTSNAAKHDEAQLLVIRTGKVGPYMTYGLAFGTNKGTGGSKGNGLVCEQAMLLLDRSVLTCTKTFRNPNGLVIGEETLTVGVTGSHYCEALKQSLVPDGEDDKIADTSDTSCDDSNEQCICYDVRWRGNSPASPPSQGTGSGRRP